MKPFEGKEKKIYEEGIHTKENEGRGDRCLFGGDEMNFRWPRKCALMEAKETERKILGTKTHQRASEERGEGSER